MYFFFLFERENWEKKLPWLKCSAVICPHTTAGFCEAILPDPPEGRGLYGDILQHLCLTHLHGDICGCGGMTLQLLVPATACAPHQRHAGRAVDVLHLCRVLLHHLHQLLDGPAEAATPHFFKHQHYGSENRILVSASKAFSTIS